jgi:hypothetical protein
VWRGSTVAISAMNEKRLPNLHLVRTGGHDEPRPHRRARVYFAGFVGTIVLWIVSFYAALGLLHPGNAPPPPLGEITIATPMAGAILQNTTGQSEGYPLGVPKEYAWCSGSYKPPDNSAPPSDFTSVTGKGLVYPEASSPEYSSQGVITIANAKTYVHLSASREWVLVQNQATNQISGAHFASDFSAKPGKQMRLDAQPDGSVVIGAPPIGYNDQFWPTTRGTYAAGTVDGVYVQMDMRTNDPKMQLVASVGADWWRDASAGFVQGSAENSGAGISNWVKLSTQWSTIRFYSVTAAQLQAEPPPPLADSRPESQSTLIRRPANTSSPCLATPRD